MQTKQYSFKIALKAREHARTMSLQYKEKIMQSFLNRTEYFPRYENENITLYPNMDIQVEDTDSVSALFSYAEGNTVLLNFASFKKPAEGFMKGCTAQEDSLCASSFLYNVLNATTDYYEGNRRMNFSNKNRTLYINRAVYHPDIFFFDFSPENDTEEKIKKCGVISCAAPNKRAAQKRIPDIEGLNREVLRERIRFVLDIAHDQNADTLILGAWGCGNAGQDAEEVAEIFREYLTTTHMCFKKVIFPIPKEEGNDNLRKFKEVFRLRTTKEDFEALSQEIQEEIEDGATRICIAMDKTGKSTFLRKEIMKKFPDVNVVLCEVFALETSQSRDSFSEDRMAETILVISKHTFERLSTQDYFERNTKKIIMY